jgi:hypothetical protein
MSTPPLYFNRGDYIELYGFHNDTSSTNTITTSAYNFGIYQLPDFTHFSVFGKSEKVEASSGGLVTYTTTAGQYGDLTSISLPQGTWSITGMAQYYSNGAVTTTVVSLGISTTSGNSGTGLVAGLNALDATKTTTSGRSDSITVSDYEVTPTSTTTYYLKSYAATSIANLQVAYSIKARRIQ